MAEQKVIVSVQLLVCVSFYSMYKTLIFIPLGALYELQSNNSSRMFLTIDHDMISKHTFLIIVILISKHCTMCISKHEVTSC